MYMRLLSLLAIVAAGRGFAASDIRATTLAVNVGPACVMAIVNSPYAVDTARKVVSGKILFRYAIRTSQSGGSGTINLKVLGAGRSITFSTTLSGVGAAAADEQTLSSGASVVAAAFGADAHSGSTNETGTISWTAQGDAPPQFSITIDCE
jgi:hypothetical protein